MRGNNARLYLKAFVAIFFAAAFLLSADVTEPARATSVSVQSSGSNEPSIPTFRADAGAQNIRVDGGSSPAEWKAYYEDNTASSSAFSLLSYHRWSGFYTIRQPPSVSFATGAILSLTAFLSGIISLGVNIMGIILELIAQTQILLSLSYTVDRVFASIGRSFTFSSLSSLPFISLLMIGAIFSAMFNFRRGGVRGVVRSVAVSAVAYLIFSLMVSAASRNHAEFNDGGALSAVGRANGQMTKDQLAAPGSWAAGSPGWVISWGLKGQNAVSGISSKVADALSARMNPVSNASEGSCSHYVDAIYATYDSHKAVKAGINGAMGVPRSYSTLIDSVQRNPYIIASMGTSKSSGNAWCRVAEIDSNTPAGSQLYIAQRAGLYKELYSGDKAVIDQGGNWLEGGRLRAQQFFAPTSGVSVIRARNYFAACEWAPNGDVQLNPEWAGVYKPSDDFLSKISEIPILGSSFGKLAELRDSLLGVEDKFVREDCFAGFLENGLDGDAAKPFTIYEQSSVMNLLGINSSETISLFRDADPRARDYYRRSSGMDSEGTLFFILPAAIGILIVGRYVLPLATGVLLLQLSASAAVAASVIVLAFMILPIPFVREIFRRIGNTVLWGLVGQSIFTLIFAALMFMINITRVLIVNPVSSAPIQTIQIIIALTLAVWGFKHFSQNVLGFDPSSFRSTIKAVGGITGNTALGIPPNFGELFGEKAKQAAGFGGEGKQDGPMEVEGTFSEEKGSKKSGPRSKVDDQVPDFNQDESKEKSDDKGDSKGKKRTVMDSKSDGSEPGSGEPKAQTESPFSDVSDEAFSDAFSEEARKTGLLASDGSPKDASSGKTSLVGLGYSAPGEGLQLDAARKLQQGIVSNYSGKSVSPESVSQGAFRRVLSPGSLSSFGDFNFGPSSATRNITANKVESKFDRLRKRAKALSEEQLVNDRSSTDSRAAVVAMFGGSRVSKTTQLSSAAQSAVAKGKLESSGLKHSIPTIPSMPRGAGAFGNLIKDPVTDQSVDTRMIAGIAMSPVKSRAGKDEGSYAGVVYRGDKWVPVGTSPKDEVKKRAASDATRFFAKSAAGGADGNKKPVSTVLATANAVNDMASHRVHGGKSHGDFLRALGDSAFQSARDAAQSEVLEERKKTRALQAFEKNAYFMAVSGAKQSGTSATAAVAKVAASSARRGDFGEKVAKSARLTASAIDLFSKKKKDGSPE